MHKSFKNTIYIIIFESSTKLGFLFDIALIGNILLSTVIMMLDSITHIHLQYNTLFDYIEWILTTLFLIEYILRIYSNPNRKKYMCSFFGIIDLICIFPSFLGLFFLNSQYLGVLRLLRVLRIFRILRLIKFLEDSAQLLSILKMSLQKIIIFIFAEVILTIVLGAIMYAIEGEANGFTSIPKSIYWAIVTMTTVGYGDISPQTSLGQAIAAFFMIIAYGIVVISAGMIAINTHNNNSTPNTSKNSTPEYLTCPHCNTNLSKYMNAFNNKKTTRTQKDNTRNYGLNYNYCPSCGHQIKQL